MLKNVIIISTGEELLYGRTIDTNSAYISSRLFETNFQVTGHISVGDSMSDILQAINRSLQDADIVITTGGLGPTDDDNTVGAICSIFGLEPVPDEKAQEKMNRFFSSMKMPVKDTDYKMISVPQSSIVIENSNGLAPGFVIHRDEKILISLPGVPAEMTGMVDSKIIPFLEKNAGLHRGKSLSYRVTGIRESEINGLMRNLLLPESVKWGITAKTGICELTIVSRLEDFKEIDDIDGKIKSSFNEFLLGSDFESPEAELVYLLKERGMTVSTAESCTGGLIAKRITDVPGASDVFNGSVVAYSNDVKIRLLDVPADILSRHGAVSEETAGFMAEGVMRKMNTDIGISTTGIAGPGGGNPEKPVGTICFGFAFKDRTVKTTRMITGSRERVRLFTSLYSINYIRKLLKET